MKKRVWFITGISSGLGAAMAEKVIHQGDFLVGTFRKQAQVDAFNAQHEGNAHAVLVDLTDQKQIVDSVRQIIAKFGKIDVLVNNAGVGFAGAVEEASMAEVRKVFECNLFGTLRLTQAVLPHMRAEKQGHILQISSHAGIKAFAGFGIYNASKFALEGFSEALAAEVAPLGIKITIVEPGPFRTNFAGSGLLEATKEIQDYGMTAGSFRKKLRSVHGIQEGDPQKAASVLMDVVDADCTSLRLPLGKIALATISSKLESIASDMAKNKHLAERAVYNRVE